MEHHTRPYSRLGSDAAVLDPSRRRASTGYSGTHSRLPSFDTPESLDAQFGRIGIA